MTPINETFSSDRIPKLFLLKPSLYPSTIDCCLLAKILRENIHKHFSSFSHENVRPSSCFFSEQAVCCRQKTEHLQTVL